jgi:hypothetical protein
MGLPVLHSYSFMADDKVWAQLVIYFHTNCPSSKNLAAPFFTKSPSP